MTVAVDLADPDTFVHGPPHEALAELRRSDPVHFCTMDDGGFWAVLKHADVVKVARSPGLFSASEGGVVIETLAPEQVAAMRGMLLAMDPPRHLDYRRPMLAHFGRTVIGRMEDQIRGVCVDIMDKVDTSSEVEFVHDVTADLPSRVIGTLMGLPEEDWGRIHEMAERNTSGQDADYASNDGGGGATMDMAMYAIGLAQQRRTEEPREDLTSVILGTEFGGHLMDDFEFGSFFVQLVTAGNDTTKTMLSSGILRPVDPSRPAQRGPGEPVADRRRRRGDPALGQSPALFPSHRHGRDHAARRDHQPRRQGGDVLHLGQPRRGRSSTTPRASTSTGTPTRTCRSASPSTSASVCTWPGSKGGCSSRSS